RQLVPASRVQDRRIARSPRGLARLAVARNRAINEARIARRQRFVAQAQALHDTGAKVLHYHVGLGRKLEREVDALGAFQVEDDALLARIEAAEIRAVAAARRRLAKRRARPRHSALQ